MLYVVLEFMTWFIHWIVFMITNGPIPLARCWHPAESLLLLAPPQPPNSQADFVNHLAIFMDQLDLQVTGWVIGSVISICWTMMENMWHRRFRNEDDRWDLKAAIGRLRWTCIKLGGGIGGNQGTSHNRRNIWSIIQLSYITDVCSISYSLSWDI